MTFLVAIYLYAVAGVLIWLMLRQHRLGVCELLSLRNFALAGFILFQLSSAAVSLMAGNYGDFHLENPTRTSLEFAAMASTVLVVAMWSYNKGFLVNRLAERTPVTSANPSALMILVMSVVMTLLAGLMRIGVRIPVVNLLATEIGTAFAAMACGMVGWVWGKRLLNPALWLYGGCVVVANFGIVAYEQYGRRGLVACSAALLWGMYHSHWKNLPLPKLFARAALIAAGPLIIVALFTSARHMDKTSLADHLHNMSRGGDISKGLFLLVEGQNTGSSSMWLIEAYPDDFRTRPLMTLWHSLIYPIPRVIWEDKPLPLGQIMARQARIPKADWDLLNLGPGIVGSAAAEGGWYALVIYGILGGLFLRYFDEVVRLNPHAPFVILPIGTALGHIVGLARGETSTLVFLTILSVSSSYVTMVLIGKVFERTGWSRRADSRWPETEDQEDAWWDYGEGDMPADQREWAPR